MVEYLFRLSRTALLSGILIVRAPWFVSSFSHLVHSCFQLLVLPNMEPLHIGMVDKTLCNGAHAVCVWRTWPSNGDDSHLSMDFFEDVIHTRVMGEVSLHKSRVPFYFHTGELLAQRERSRQGFRIFKSLTISGKQSKGFIFEKDIPLVLGKAAITSAAMHYKKQTLYLGTALYVLLSPKFFLATLSADSAVCHHMPSIHLAFQSL